MQKKHGKDINEDLRKILEHIKTQRNKAAKEGLKFSSLTEEQLRRKLKSLKTPFITSANWTSYAPASSNFVWNIYIYNPDPVDYYNVIAYAFFGPANPISDIGLALISADQQLNRMFTQNNLISGATGSFSFNVRFPTGTRLGLHLINAFIFVENWYDVADFIDRACADMTIT